MNADEVRSLRGVTGRRETRMRVAAPEFRDNEDGGFTIAGYASVTDASYEVNDFMGAYSETISRGAFGKSLREADDVRLLVNHDGIPLARTRSNTLQLSEITKPADDPQGRNQTGLWASADLDASSPLAQSVRSAMARGDMSEMSFAFQATRQEWNDDYSQRSINEVKLFDVSVVTYPANPATSVSLTSARVAGLVSRAADGKAITDPDDLAIIRELAPLLDAADETRDSEPVEVEPVEPSVDLDVRSRALALAKAKAARR